MNSNCHVSMIHVPKPNLILSSKWTMHGLRHPFARERLLLIFKLEIVFWVLIEESLFGGKFEPNITC